jgi:hypothetical protein
VAPQSHSLVGRLVDGNSAYRWLIEKIINHDRPVDICSAFLRSEALAAMLQDSKIQSNSRILVRWRLGDLLAGASDFEAYDIAVSRGMSMYMRLDFHGKIYSIPPQGVIVGSANATLSGLGLGHSANSEVCTLIDFTEDNQRLIDGLFSNATLIDEALLAALKKVVELSDSGSMVDQEWPSHVTARLQNKRDPNSLLVDECFWDGPYFLVPTSAPFTTNQVHDQTLLGVFGGGYARNLSKVALKTNFVGTSIYNWFFTFVERNGGEVYFGRLTEALHNALLDDPAPSRQSVKRLLQNLLEWVTALDISEVVVDRPRHSQRIRLTKLGSNN